MMQEMTLLVHFVKYQLHLSEITDTDTKLIADYRSN